MAEDLSESDRELIREYREYNEDTDQGQHERSRLIARLSKRIGSSNLMRIEDWVSKQERIYGLVSTTASPETETEGYLDRAILKPMDPEQKAFFERLIISRDNYKKSTA